MKIRVGGVPEHFNMPWHYGIEKGFFSESNIEVDWTDYPGGTGAMCKDLREEKLDVAVLLTEGAVADILKGNPSKIVSLYVSTPLIWGIHTGIDSGVDETTAYSDGKFAISRKGSGSHLMAYVAAETKGQTLHEDKHFEITNNLKESLKSLADNKTQFFLWEKYTTAPYVEKGLIRRIGECPTPWPCFVIVVRNEFLNQYKSEIQQLLSALHRSMTALETDLNLISIIAQKFNLDEALVRTWKSQTEWYKEDKTDFNAFLPDVVQKLKSYGILPKGDENDSSVTKF